MTVNEALISFVVLLGVVATWRLLRTCPNLYADLSANSGFNAITRDPEAGYRFLDEFQDKLLFGTDTCFAEVRTPHLPYLRELLSKGKLSQVAFDKITSLNAQKLLGMI